MTSHQERQISAFRRALLSWYGSNARDFPWRQERTPYRTVMAEIMLRRTQANQVVPVYHAFMERYPTLADAAREDPDTIREHLKPLGLEWRAQNAVDFVREAHARYGEHLPADRDAVGSLPGVGDYVSAAVMCFAGGEAVPLIDTNVVRVLGRVFGLRTGDEARRCKDMRALATRAVDPACPAEYHYALLDLAATTCRPRKPRCGACPLRLVVPCAFARDCNY